MSTEFDEQCQNAAGDGATPLYKNSEISDSHNDEHHEENLTQNYDEQEDIAPEPTLHAEEEPVEPSTHPAEDERSRHTSTSSSSTEPIQEEHEPIAELKKAEFEPTDEYKNNEENRENGSPPKQIRPLQQPDFTQQATAVKKEIDENDWASKNIGSGKIKNLISLFNSGTDLKTDNKANGPPGTYKSDYGVGQGKGQLRQDVFH